MHLLGGGVLFADCIHLHKGNVDFFLTQDDDYEGPHHAEALVDPNCFKT
jgi:hypothetical protein